MEDDEGSNVESGDESMSEDLESPQTPEKYDTRKKEKRHSSTPISEEKEEAPPSFSLATLGLQRVGTAPPPKPQPQQPIQMLNARGMPARIRKRNRYFFDDDIINDDKPLRMSLSPRKMTLKSSHSPAKTPQKLLKKRNIKSEEKPPPAKLKCIKPHQGGSGNAIKLMVNSTNSKPKSPDVKNVDITTNSDLVDITPNSDLVSNLPAVIPVDKKAGQRIGMCLRNLLKLPKAHKWVIYEWFYSFIDKPLFGEENDFQICFAQSFPHLRTRLMTRGEWQRVRSLMGKPRRCSPAFFEEERRELEKKRQKIRFMQTRRSGEVKDLSLVRDLPDKIPLPLPVGTKVTARLRVPQDGVFSGTVDAFESTTSTYRVTFDRTGLGTHSIPDYEIVSESFFEMLPLQSITKLFRPNLMNVYNGGFGSLLGPLRGPGGMRQVRSSNNMNKSDPLLGQEIIVSPFKNPVLREENINGYPPKLLETLVRLKRALKIKQSKLQRLSDMNNEAELKASQQLVAAHSNSSASSSDESQMANAENPPAPLSEEFQRRYASIVISMEKMNRDIQDYLNDVQGFSGDLTRDPQVQAMLAPSYLREKCREAAEDAVKRNNQNLLTTQSILALIKKLATVLFVASHLSTDNSAQVNKVLEGCIEEVRSSLYGVNVETFQKNVQIHLHHIRLGISQSMMSSSSNASGAVLNMGNVDR